MKRQLSAWMVSTAIITLASIPNVHSQPTTKTDAEKKLSPRRADQRTSAPIVFPPNRWPPGRRSKRLFSKRVCRESLFIPGFTAFGNGSRTVVTRFTSSYRIERPPWVARPGSSGWKGSIPTASSMWPDCGSIV